jgi:hypothetical protein
MRHEPEHKSAEVWSGMSFRIRRTIISSIAAQLMCELVRRRWIALAWGIRSNLASACACSAEVGCWNRGCSASGVLVTNYFRQLFLVRT